MDAKGWCEKLNDGHVIPVLGFGTYAAEEVTVAFLVQSIEKKLDVA